MDAKSLGQIAYEAFGEDQAWIAEDGTLMRSWESLSSTRQAGWQACAKAVATAVTKARHQSEIEAIEEG